MSGEAKRLSAEDREICRHFIQRRAYYYGVGPVGCEPINILLGAVNRAGKMYHHTEGWTEPSSYATTGDGSCVDIIDAAAYEAAEYISRIERERDEALEKAELSATRLVSECDRSEQKDKRIAELEAENARLREDAERYEYLRNPHNETYFLYQKDGFGGVELMSGPSLDDAIDEARKP